MSTTPTGRVTRKRENRNKVHVDRDGNFAIDKILKTKRGSDGKISYFVSWLGYPAKFNSWVHDLVNIDTG